MDKDFLKKIKDSLVEGKADPELEKINTIFKKSESVNVNSSESKSNDSILKDNDELYKPFVNFIISYNTTINLIDTVDLSKLKQHELEIFNNIKNKFV